MAAADRAYTSEYSYLAPSNYAGEFMNQIPRRRTHVKEESGVREKQKNNTGIEVLPQKGTKELLSRAGLLRAIIIMSAIGVLLIGSVWMNAKATDIKYSINKVNKECMTFEDEIDLLKVKIETANGIEAVEAYAIKEMGMKYPRTDQCIYIAEDAVVKDNLAEIIRQKAYK